MRVLITGGAGFIGCNVANHHLQKGDEVVIFDNLQRVGTDINLQWLKEKSKNRIVFIKGDIRDRTAVNEAVSSSRPERIYHMAGQVAVTTSVLQPYDDFEVNALGTVNVLESVRLHSPASILIFASTNKVYGGLDDVQLGEEKTRYQFKNRPLGISEDQQLDFHSPYGCSKGAADQYVRDYSRIYGLRTIVFRQSCIYGERQFGVEDQGWVAHFCIAAKQNRPMTVYGTGKQVRDLLWIDDLVEAYDVAAQKIDKTSGQIYNIGGGPRNTLSIWCEFEAWLRTKVQKPLQVTLAERRPGDQDVYISSIEKIGKELSWSPRVSVADGLDRLWAWINVCTYFK